MKKLIAASLVLLSTPALGAGLKVTVSNLEEGARVPAKHSYCIATDAEKSAPGENISPAISWEKGPEGTKSYAVIVVDRDVPTKFDDAGKEGKTLPSDMPRQNFYHWILLNVPAETTSTPEGAGKNAAYGNQMVNDYLKFSGKKANAMNIAAHTGYDGPCPPWNDERLHHYHFKVLALDDRFTIPENQDYSGDEIMKKITPHILSQGEVTLNYTLNPALLKGSDNAE